MTEIEHIYITHWKPLTQRKEYLENKLKELNLINKVTFMEKWDRNDKISQVNSKKFYTENNPDNWVIRGIAKHYKMSKDSFRNLYKGEIYNFLNHYECYKDMYMKGYNNALILEDDCILLNNFTENLDKYIKQIKPYDWDILFLGDYCHHLYKWPIHDKINNNIYHAGMSNTADAYVLSKSGVKTIIKNNTFPFSFPIDFEMNYWIVKFNMKSFWVTPSIIKQGSVMSNVNNHYKSTAYKERTHG